MMTDPASPAMSSHRFSRSSAMNRPAQSPMGPRIRFTPSTSSLDTASSRDSLLTISEPSPAYPMSPIRSDAALPSIVEQPTTPPPTTPGSNSTASTPQSAFKVLPKSAALVQPPTLKFDSVPVQWKAFSHEAALWTFDNRELQELVSRAIRRSSPDTYIRLLSVENLDQALPAEVDRLTSLKATKQAQYRFLVQRRTMMLRALNSSFLSPEKVEADDGIPVASGMALQLSQTAAECDQLVEDLLVITDQLEQISGMLERHWASALAVALRKLNKSYAKRTSELVSARGKISQLEAELEEAWKEAERVAKEIDEMEKEGLDSDEEEEEEEEAVIETAEKVDISRSRHASRIPAELLIQSRRNTGHMEALPMFSPISPMPRLSAIAPPISAGLAPAPTSPMTPPGQDKDETASIRSAKSMKSTRSVRSTRSARTPDGTRLSLVSAAKTRSHRASKGSLRLSKPKTPVPHPPMPDLPLEFSSTPLNLLSSKASSHLWPDSASHISTGRERRTSLDDLRPPRPSTSSYTPTVTMDDIYIRLQPRTSAEIQVVPRSPPPPSKFPDQPSKSIPSMWLMADAAPKPVAAAGIGGFPSTQRPGTSSSSQTYKKLKILTKRYSMPFPLFKSKSTESQTVSPSRSAPPGTSVGSSTHTR
ncbi:hypothetical protein FPV67DRAFT_619783 [Lyophyllum atratum]|nr:hypothetical protein FPV67DRAFT_619783 [Lyophyllum atratum]